MRARIDEVPQNNKTPAGAVQPINNIKTDMTPDMIKVCFFCLGSPPCCCNIIGIKVAPAKITIKIKYGIIGKYPISPTWFHMSCGEHTRSGIRLKKQ